MRCELESSRSSIASVIVRDVTGNVLRVRGCCHLSVCETGVGIDSDTGLRLKMVLVSLLSFAHLRLARTILILGRIERRDQRRVNAVPLLRKSPFGLERRVNFGQWDLG